MSKTSCKFKYFCRSTIKNVFTLKLNSNHLINLKLNRASSIPLSFFLRSIKVHNGLRYKKFFVNNLKVGFKNGEFAFTRKPYFFPLRKKKLK